MRNIELLISPTGEIRLETHGFTGPACQVASRFLQQALGRSVSEKLTTEYHQQSASLSTEIRLTN